MEELRFGIIGSGGMAHARAERITRNPRGRLICVASRNPTTGQALAKAYGVPFLPDWQALIERGDVDALLVATHQGTHALMSLAALGAGKHVFTESPMALSMDDADAIIQRMQANGLALRVGHTSVLQNVHTLMKIEAGALGNLLLAVMHIHWNNDTRGEQLAGFHTEISGHPFFMGITLAFPIFDLCPDVTWVDAHCTFHNLDAAGAFDKCMASMQVGFANGGIGQVVYARGLAQPGSAWRRFLFSEGTLEYRQGEPHVRKATTAGEVSLPIPDVDAWQVEVDDFITGVLDGTPLLVSPEEARRVVVIGAEAVTSATEGRRVSLSV
jgi:predicted dehydrogenase